MGLFRKILIFFVLTAGIIALGRLAGRVLPGMRAEKAGAASAAERDSLRDSTNALPAVEADTTGGRWHDRLFDPLESAHGLGPKSLKRKPGFYEITLPKGKPIHEYALEIEKTCRAHGITVVQGAELRPAGKSVEYLLESNGQRIKLRASLGASVMAGAARLAVVFTRLDSLSPSQAETLKAAPWPKTLVIDPYDPNPALVVLSRGNARDDILVELPMEPAAYPYVDPGKHALFIHHSREDVERILDRALDSLPKAAGFASRYGDRAIENLPLLEKLFRFTAARKLLFLDFTGSQRSLARQAAAAQGARSRTLILFRDSAHVEEELARKAAFAQKSGEAVLALPYSPSAFRALSRSLEANQARFNAIGLELVALSDLALPDSAAPAPEAAKPAGKPADARGPVAPAAPAAPPAAAKPGASVSGGKPTPAKPAAGASRSDPARRKPAVPKAAPARAIKKTAAPASKPAGAR